MDKSPHGNIRFNSPKGEKAEILPVIARERRAKADRVDLANKLVNLNINTDKIKAVSFWNSPAQTPISKNESPKEFNL